MSENGAEIAEANMSQVWAALSKSSQTSTNPEQMVRDLYGVTRRGAPDTRAAAAALGVSQRTVQRWIRAGRLPVRARTGGPAELQQRHRAWKASPEGRRAALSPRREARLRNKGTTIRFLGVISISADRRRRSTSVLLSGDQMSRILDAALAGDDVAAHEALEDAFGESFGGSVTLSEIGSLSTYR